MDHSSNFEVPQVRKRIYIVGTKNEHINLDDFPIRHAKLNTILENGLPTLNTEFINKLFEHYTIEELHGKSIKDKRGGKNNIHAHINESSH